MIDDIYVVLNVSRVTKKSKETAFFKPSIIGCVTVVNPSAEHILPFSHIKSTSFYNFRPLS